ncbi:hypothetical protein TNCV_4084141 [Trichonephila clavipes]|nr:hypothetical protein TNCV_4084141 [Trichonephila clavipes]
MPLQKTPTHYEHMPLIEKGWAIRLGQGNGFMDVCHEFESGTAEVPPCRGGGCTSNTSRLKRPPIDVVWKLGEGMQSQLSSSSFDHRSKLRGPSPKALE